MPRRESEMTIVLHTLSFWNYITIACSPADFQIFSRDKPPNPRLICGLQPYMFSIANDAPAAKYSYEYSHAFNQLQVREERTKEKAQLLFRWWRDAEIWSEDSLVSLMSARPHIQACRSAVADIKIDWRRKHCTDVAHKMSYWVKTYLCWHGTSISKTRF